MVQDYEKIKGEIADSYIEKFKGELGRFKSIAVLPMEGKLKKIMISDQDLEGKTLNDLDDLGRWRNILGAITPNIANDIFDFLKEKQSLIIQAETANKLDELRNEVVLGEIIPETTEDDQISTEDQTTDVTTTTTTDTTSPTTDRDTETGANENEPGTRNSVQRGVVVGVTGATAYQTMKMTVNKYNDMNLKRQLDFNIESQSAKQEIKKLSDKMDKLSNELYSSTKNQKLSRAVRNNLQKSAKKFSTLSADMADEGVITAWNARGKLGKDMPAEILTSMDAKSAKKFANMDDKIFEQIAKSADADEITGILAKQGIGNVKPEMIDILKNMDELENIKAFSKILEHGKKLSPIMKGLSMVAAIDLLFFGFDVRMRNESMNATDFVAKVNESRASVMRNKANFELMMGVSSIVLQISAILVAGKIGTTAGTVVPGIGNAIGLAVGVLVGVVVATVQEMVNQLYYDKLMFYKQNKEDYIRQERTGIKQAILQCAKEQEVNTNPKLTNKALNEKGINTFQEAWKALIFQEEIEKYNKGLWPKGVNLSLIVSWYVSGMTKSDYYITTLSDDDKIKWAEERNIMNARIDKRMEYVKKFITKESGTAKYQEFMQNIKMNTGLSYIEKIIGESDVYMEMMNKNNEYMVGFQGTTVNEYMMALGKNLKTTYPEEYEIFENLYDTNIYEFKYICTGVNKYFNITNEEVYTATEFEAIKRNKEFITKFYHYKTLGLTVENTKNITVNYTNYDFNYLERVLIDLNEINKRSVFNNQDVINYFSSAFGLDARMETNYQVSSSTGQNIIYRMAREFHGYAGNNDMFDLMNFYNASSDKIKGMYYDNERMINNDENTFGGDRRYNSSQAQFILGGFISSAIINRFSTIDRGRNLDDIDKNNMTADEVYDKFNDVLMLDSKVDVADKEAVNEFRAEIKKIIKEEIAAKSPENKKKVEKEIVDFVKAQSKGIGNASEIADDGSLKYSGTNEQGYVEIPYSLIIAAKKAKIGDIEKFLFKYENDRLVAVSSQQYVDTKLDFDTTIVNYEKVSPLRNELTIEENSIIAKVDQIKERLRLLRSVESAREDKVFGGFRNELNIPIEVEREMTKMVYERETLKESLLYLNIANAKSKLSENWYMYYKYFNGTYMGMLATISQFTINNNLGNFSRMSQAWAWIDKEKYKIDENGEVNFDHLEIEDDEKEYIIKYIKKSYQGETKTVEELLKSNDEAEKQKGERMLDQIMVSIFETEVLYMTMTGKNITRIEEDKSYRSDKEKEKNIDSRIKINLESVAYVDVMFTLAEIDHSTITKNTQEIKKVSETEKSIYEKVNVVLDEIVDTMNNVDRGHGRGELKFTVNNTETTDTKLVGYFESRGQKMKTSADIVGDIFTIDGLSYSFSDMNQWVYTANLMSRIHGYYLKQNPDKAGQFFFGRGSSGFFADRKRNPNDIEILEGDTVASKFSWLYKNKTNQEKFLKVVNNIK